MRPCTILRIGNREIALMSSGLKHQHQRLPGSSFLGVDLGGSRFDDVNLLDARLNNVSLAGAVLRDTSLEQADIADCNLQGLRIDGILVSDLLASHAELQRRGPPAALVIYAKNQPRLAAFYIELLALTVTHDEAGFTVLQGAGVALNVVQIPPLIADTFTLSAPPALREDTPLKPVFTVHSLQAVRLALDALGGGMRPPEAEWNFGGHRVLDGHDPEGNVLQFRQRVG